jgi:pimeloyl-ACP methyl ester carboxylesterase
MKQTFLLIHGGWHGGWAWRPVAEHLRAAGHQVYTPTLPGFADSDERAGRSLAEVVDFIVEYVEHRDLRDVVLVGHSWAGYPITGAAPRLVTRLSKLIYWSAFVPAEGRSMLDECPPEVADVFRQLSAASPDQSVGIDFGWWASSFMQDAPEAVQRLVHSLMVSEPLAYVTQTVPALDLTTFKVPIAYIVGTEDLAVPPGDFTVKYPSRLGVVPSTTPGSHEALYTRPAELAQALLDA